MKTKLLALDLDGTLLNDEKTVTPATMEAIRAAMTAGHKVMIATGRPLPSAIACAKKYLPDTPGSLIIALNGGIVYDCDSKKVISRKTMSLDLVQTLFDLADEEGQYIHTYSDEKVLTRRDRPELHYYVSFTGQEFECNEDFPKGIDKPSKVLLANLTDHESLERFEEKAAKIVGDKCEHFFSCPEYLEFCPIGSSKGFALLDAAKILGIAPEDTYAAGDEENDLSMIKMAGVGIAMCNGQPHVKQYADYITEHDNNHDGIAEIIKRFLL